MRSAAFSVNWRAQLSDSALSVSSDASADLTRSARAAAFGAESAQPRQEFQVSGLAAGRGIDQHQRHALMHRLGSTQTAGLGDKQIAGIQIIAHALRIAQHIQLLGMHLRRQAALKRLVAAAYGHEQRVRRQSLHHVDHHRAHAARAHAAAADERDLFIFGQAERPPCGRLVSAPHKIAANWNAGGNQLFPGNAEGGKFVDQLRVRNEPRIHIQLVHARTAGVIRGQKIGGQRNIAVLSQLAHEARCKHMHADNGVKAAAFQIAPQIAFAPGQMPARAFAIELALVALLPRVYLGKAIAYAVHLGQAAVHEHMSLTDQLARGGGHEAQPIVDYAFCAARQQRFLNGARCGIVSLAGVSRQYQYFHAGFSPPAASTASPAKSASDGCSAE